MKRHVLVYLVSLAAFTFMFVGSNAFVATKERVARANGENGERTGFYSGANDNRATESAGRRSDSGTKLNEVEAVTTAATLTLRQNDFQGGAGDQRSADLYIAAAGGGSHQAWVAGTDGPNGLLIGYELTTFSSSFYTTLSSNAGFEGLTQSGSTVYPVGGALPPTCGASDGVGDTEGKSILARYTTGGVSIGCQSTNFFPYRGGEGNSHTIAVTESGTPYVYVTSHAENCGFGHTVFVLTKYDAGGGMISKVTEPGVSFGGFNCIGGSNAFGLVALNGDYYVAGQSNLTGAGETGGFRPVLMKYDPSLSRIWKQRPSDVTGMFTAVAAFGGALYAVGATSGNDYLIEKYDEAGNRAWSKISGGAGADVLTGVTSVGSHLFAVGYTNSDGAGGYDAVILEIDPATGNTLMTTHFGGAQDDKANAAASDGTYLYVAGESRSFASGAGNVVGQNDAILLQFCLDNCFVVTNTNDSGAGSLRQAITNANANSGPNNVIFNIPTNDPGFVGGVFTIKPSSSALPTLRNNTTIDGNTQTIFTGDSNVNGPEVVVNGSMLSSGEGFFISGDNNTISGLVVNGFNGGGITFSYGLDSTPSNNQVRNNYVGTDAAGSAAVPNLSGIGIHGFGSPSVQASNNVIQNNLVSGNSGAGIGLCDAAQTNISNNLIGTDRTGTANLGNGSHGIYFLCAGAPNNLVDSNTIAFNGADGIRIEPDYRFLLSGMTGNKFTRNSIYSNGGLGINLLPPPFGTVDGVTPNDPGDGDAGGNNLQNFPVLTAANHNGATTDVQGSLNSAANTSFRIEFFSQAMCDSSGNGEGQNFRGFTSVTTDGSGDVSFSVSLPSVPVGQVITATATDPANNTSEFSACRTVCVAPSISADPSNQTVCSGASAGFSVTASGSSLTYAWRKNGSPLSNGGNISGADTATLTINPTSSLDIGSYDVIVGGCNPPATSMAATLTVNAPPGCSISGASAVCAGSTGNTFSAPIGGTLTYGWSISGAGTIFGSTTSQLVSVNTGSSGSFTLTLMTSDTTTGCSSSCMKTVTLTASPSCSVTGAGAVCAGSTGNNYSGPSGTLFSYVWSISGNGTIAGGNIGQSVTVSAGGPGSYMLTLNVTNGDGCNSMCNKTVTVNANPAITLDRDHQSFAANGGSGSMAVTASNAICPWQASTTSSFVTINSGSPGIGNGSVQYSVAANAGSTIRSDTITIGDQTFTVYQGINFADVPSTHPFYDDIGKLSARGVTVGCGNGNYCPNDPVSREQMAAFILRAKGEFDPPTPASQRFNDVPPQNVFYNFIDRLAELGITLGCSTSPPLYCPTAPVLREQMAAFILRGLGEFNPPTPLSQRFNDVPPENVFYNFIDRLAVLQITLGCTPDHLMYCPNAAVTRAQMAAFLVRAFDL
jgi:parallel beta-helix repeat protein